MSKKDTKPEELEVTPATPTIGQPTEAEMQADIKVRVDEANKEVGPILTRLQLNHGAEMKYTQIGIFPKPAYVDTKYPPKKPDENPQ